MYLITYLKELRLGLIIGSMVLALNTCYSQSTNSEFLAAEKATGSLKLEEARQLYGLVIETSNVTNEYKCKALRRLAVQDWKFYRNYTSAKQRALEADSIGNRKTNTWLVLNRIEKESGKFILAKKAADMALNFAESRSDSIKANYAFCKTILEETTFQIQNNQNYDTAELLIASQKLKDLLFVNPTNINAADVLLGVSLLLKDGPEALNAWLAYFRFSDSGKAHDYLKEAAESLNEILPEWKNKVLSDNETIKLYTAIGQSRFYKYVDLLSKTKITSKVNNSDTKHLIRYSNYLEDLRVKTNEYYRKTAIKDDDNINFIEMLTSKNQKLYDVLINQKLEKDTFSIRNFRRVIRQKFGAVQLVARTNSTDITGLVMGHIVNERVRTIEQYGYKADFTFTELDMMISNNYASWFWEDRGAGGYAIRNGFLRIKEMFKDLAINAWSVVTDSTTIKRYQKIIDQNLKYSNLTSNKSNVLYGLSYKLELDALSSLYMEVYNKGFRNTDLQLKFIEHYEAFRDNATMFAHEGRHSIDRALLADEYREMGGAMIEYRGRLSQIAFSESPKLELMGMIDAIGSHAAGQANKMIVDVAEKWILGHSDSIEDYDNTKLPISQLYRMTNEQIRECYRDVDPLYIKQ